MSFWWVKTSTSPDGGRCVTQCECKFPQPESGESSQGNLPNLSPKASKSRNGADDTEESSEDSSSSLDGHYSLKSSKHGGKREPHRAGRTYKSKDSSSSDEQPFVFSEAEDSRRRGKYAASKPHRYRTTSPDQARDHDHDRDKHRDARPRYRANERLDAAREKGISRSRTLSASPNRVGYEYEAPEPSGSQRRNYPAKGRKDERVRPHAKVPPKHRTRRDDSPGPRISKGMGEGNRDNADRKSNRDRRPRANDSSNGPKRKRRHIEVFTKERVFRR